jgi:hypothetical protein
VNGARCVESQLVTKTGLEKRARATIAPMWSRSIFTCAAATTLSALIACTNEAPRDAGSDATTDAPSSDARSDAALDATTTDATRTDSDASDGDGDAAMDDARAVRVPSAITAELVYEAPAGARTPPTWNAHLPKLVGDDRDFYAVFTHYPEAVADRYAVVVRRPRAGGAWSEAARFASVHQPPGIVMTRARALHLAFDCLRAPGTGDVECFRGGAGTNGLVSRFYRLVFSARDAAGALRWDSYGNYSEWVAESNGYIGLAVAPDDHVHWSLLDASMNRIAFRSDGGAGAPMHTLSEAGRPLLYPLAAWDRARLLLFAGEFDPRGGSNAGYPASSLYTLSAGAPSRILRVTPEVAVGAGMVGAFPSDLEVGDDGTLYALSYQRRADAACTTLFRSDRADRFVAIPVGCFDTYARLQLVDDHTLLLLASGAGASLRVGVSADRGDTWRWTDVQVRGANASDVSLFGYTLIDPRSAPGVFQSRLVRMVFSGSDSAGLARRLYFAEWSLE